MHKIGIIGNINAVMHIADILGKIKGVALVGKSSIGLLEYPAESPMTIPEYDRQQLIDETDALIIEKFSLLPFELIKDAVKKGRSIFFTEFPEFTEAMCQELVKLSIEACTFVQFRNAVVADPVSDWIVGHCQQPAYVNVSEALTDFSTINRTLTGWLLFAHNLFKIPPQKVRVMGVHNLPANFSFINLRLDYANHSAVNLELSLLPTAHRQFRVASPEGYFDNKIISQLIARAGRTLDGEDLLKNELVSFLAQIEHPEGYQKAGLATWNAVMQLRDLVLKKIALYAPSI